MSRTSITRRSFLGTAASAAAFTIVPAHVLGGPRHRPPSEKLNIAGIGVGGMGHGNLAALESENIVALCDVDPNYAAKSISKYPRAKVWTDYREMLEKQKDIDAVLIATPDHTHAVITMAALKAGKHVYCQKPLTHDIYEARAVVKAARAAKVTTQMGIQGHSGEGVRLICEWIADGAIGEVREVDVWCNDSYYPWGKAGWSPGAPERPKETPALPDGMNWDLWIGPAPVRPYHKWYHPMAWRAWWDFGSGWMADRGAHQIDPAYWALKLGAPTWVEATQLGQTDETHCVAAVVTYQFPARGNMPPVKLTWYDGGKRPAFLKDRGVPEWDSAVLFLGEKGMLVANYGDRVLLPKEQYADFKAPAPTIPNSIGHHEEWIAACKTGSPTTCNFDYSGALTESALLAAVSYRSGKRIEWDAENLKATNCPEAEPLIRREYRAGWTL